MAAMARPAPVLPLVPSMIVPPGFSSPFRSASSIIATPIRSLTEPPGLKNSTFASSVPGRSAPSRCRRTSGVLPMVSRMESDHMGRQAGGRGRAESYAPAACTGGLPGRLPRILVGRSRSLPSALALTLPASPLRRMDLTPDTHDALPLVAPELLVATCNPDGERLHG